MDKPKLVIVGQVPPPLGGVRIHVKRLCDSLDDESFDHEFIPSNSSQLGRIVTRILSGRIVHIHLSNPYVQFCLSFIGWITRGRVIVTQHGNMRRWGKIPDAAAVLSLKLAWKTIVLNDQSFQELESKRCSVHKISAFLPPIDEHELPEDIASEIERLSNGGKTRVIATNAHRYVIDGEGNELYGIRDLIRFSQDKQCALVVSDPTGTYRNTIASSDPDLIADHVYFITRPHSYNALVQRVDLMIRNTSTDGDSLSIHEALCHGTPVWATNCVSRPSGVHTYNDLSEIDIQATGLNATYEPPQTLRQLMELYRSA